VSEGSSTPQPQAAGTKAPFSPLLGKDKQNPDVIQLGASEGERREFCAQIFLPK
jgi:hypothetical protein